MGTATINSLEKQLKDVKRITLDTAPLIYFIERHPKYSSIMHEIISRIDSGLIEAYSSVITLTEVLTLPKRLGRADLETEYRSLLLHSRFFRLIPIDAKVAEDAALWRARYNLRTPDALQIAAAVISGSDMFLTNDSALQRVKELRIVTLDSFLYP